MPDQMLSPEDQMMQWITSKWVTGPIYVAAELGIADHLAAGPLGVDVLAKKTETHAPTLYRLLRALAAVGVFTETEKCMFGLTPLAECLLADRMRPLIRMFLSDWHDRTWSALGYTVRTGKPGFDHAFGQPAFEWLEANPEARFFRSGFDLRYRRRARCLSDLTAESVFPDEGYYSRLAGSCYGSRKRDFGRGSGFPLQSYCV